MTKSQAYRAGVMVGVIIAGITVVEFWIAGQPSFAFVGVMLCAAVKTALILRRYMHIDLLWSEESHH